MSDLRASFVGYFDEELCAMLVIFATNSAAFCNPSSLLCISATVSVLFEKLACISGVSQAENIGASIEVAQCSSQSCDIALSLLNAKSQKSRDAPHRSLVQCS